MIPCNYNHGLGRRTDGKTERCERNICDAINDYIDSDEGEHMFLCCKQRDYDCSDICCMYKNGQSSSDAEFATEDNDDGRRENDYPLPLMFETRSIPVNEMGEAGNNTTIVQTERAGEVVLNDVRNRIRFVHEETSGIVLGGKDIEEQMGGLNNKGNNS